MERLVLPLMMYKERKNKDTKEVKGSWVVPSWNHLYTIVRNRPILDKWALKHKGILFELAQEWALQNGWETTYNRKIIVDMWVWFPDARERDCHNLDKIVLDAFEEAEIFDNDANALVRYQDFDIDMDNPRIEVEFSLGSFFDRKGKVKELKNKSKNHSN